MPVIMGAGSQPAKCKKAIADFKPTAVYQFLSSNGAPLFSDDEVPVGLSFTVIANNECPDPTFGENAWTSVHIDKLISLGNEAAAKLNKGEYVLFVCQANKNRSPTLAGIASRMCVHPGRYPKLRILPEDKNLQKFVQIFETEDEEELERKIEDYRTNGLTGEARARRSAA
tara:strand:+ start:192 stop:704 length:513 start_codon:yes stop_codon:yes gene_type:complete